MRPARLALALLLAVVGGGGLVVRDTTASAQPTPVFHGSASAEGIRAGMVAVGAPVSNQVVDVAAPIAQASLDSTSGSAALASVAYPGDLVVTAPGLVAGFSGGQTSGVIPEYPLVAQAGSTTAPEQRADAPGSTITAKGDGGSASAVASTGSDGQGPAPTLTLTTTADVTVGEDGTVTATARSATSAVTVGPLVIGSVTATSEVTRVPGRAPARAADFEVAGLKLAGVDVALTDAGLVLAGTTVPVSASGLADVLREAGLELELLAEEETEHGVISGGLVVRRTEAVPGPVSPLTVSLTFGRSVAAVSDVAAPPLRPDHAAGPPVRPTAPPTPSAGFGTGAAPPAAPPTGAAPTTVVTAPTGFAAPLFDLGPIYLAIALAAGGAGIVVELLRHLGVRLRWT